MNWKIHYPLTKELSSHRAFYLLYLLAVVALTIFFTWPVILHLSTSIYGYSGDSFGFIYYLWLWKDHFLKGQALTFNPLVMAPFGTVIAPETGTFVYLLPSKILALLFDGVISYNVNILLSFIFSALTSYLLFHELTKNRVASAIFSLVFAFSPYHFWKAYNHLDLAMIQYIPLFLWALIKLRKTPGWLTGITAGITLAVLLLLNFYYGYFALLTIGLFFLYFLGESVVLRRVAAELKYLVLAVLIGITFSLPFIYPTISASTSDLKLPESRRETYVRPLDNLLLLSARPWSYILPSIDNSLLGKFSLSIYKTIENMSNDFKTQMPFPNEVTVYLGFFSLGFFALSLWFGWKRKIEWGLTPLLLFVAGGLFLISMPPFIIIKSVTVYFPTFFLHQLFPMFRAYGRLGIFIMPLVSGVAAFGFAHLLEKLKRPGKILLTATCFLLFILEFTNVPPARVTDFSKIPEAYTWLKEQPGDFSIMEYPKNFNLADGELFQRFHGKKIANWYSTEPYYNLWSVVENIYDPQTYGILSGLGVKYVLLHKKPIFNSPNPVDELWPTRAYTVPINYSKLPPVLNLVYQSDDIDIFLINRPVPPKAVVITPSADPQNSVKVDVVGGSSWYLTESSNLYGLNLTAATIKGIIDDGVSAKEVTLPLGLTVLKYRPGRYTINFKAL